MKKVLALLLLLLVCGSVWADGMIVDPDFYPVRQQRQQAFVNYENGTENLFIMVNLQEQIAQGQKTVWIFPVPAQPEQIKIDTLKGFPVLGGKELKQQASENWYLLEGYMAVASAAPLAVLALPLFLMTSTVSYSAGANSQEKALDQAANRGYTIYQHLDKYGMATDVIKAEDAAKFKSFLKARGTNLSPEAEELLQEYMDKDYSFIVSWITALGSAYEPGADETPGSMGYNNPVGVFIQFPSDDIYFPLHPTAYYGTDTFPVTVNIAGFKSPVIYPNIREKTKVGQYQVDFLSQTIQEQETMNKIFNGKQPESLQYTSITINSAASYFTEDLRISPSESIPANALNLFNQTWLLWMLILFAAFSYLSVSLANRLYLKSMLKRNDKILLALANFLTLFIAGLAIALMKKEKFGVEEKESGFSKKTTFLVVFEGILLGLTILLFAATLLVFAVLK